MVSPPPGDSGSVLGPEEILRHRFPIVRKGYDTYDVDNFKRAASDAYRQLEAEHADLSRRNTDLRRRLEKAEAQLDWLSNQEPPAPPSLYDLAPQELSRLVGEETAGVLEQARQASGELRARAEADATRVGEAARAEAAERREVAQTAAAERVAGAQAEAERVLESARRSRDEAEAEAAERLASAQAEVERLLREAREQLAKTKSASAEQAEFARADAADRAARLVREAEADAERIRAGVIAETETLRSDAEAEARERRESAAHDAGVVLEEAEALRGAVLADLAERRAATRAGIETMQAAHESLDEWLTGLAEVVNEAVSASHQALADARDASRHQSDHSVSVAELEAFLDEQRTGSAPSRAMFSTASPSSAMDDHEPILGSLTAQIATEEEVYLEPAVGLPSPLGGDTGSMGAPTGTDGPRHRAAD